MKIDFDNIFKILKYITYGWGVIIAIFIIANYDTNQPFNNWGDFFAGFFAPLAFMWLGYGIIIQREEFSKMAESIEKQKEEMEKHSNQFETQTNHMEQQLNMIMSQDLANWYSKYSTNMSKLYKLENDQSLISLNEEFTNPTQGLTEVLKHIENIENILLYNNQIESYFFTENKKMEKIQKMLKIDYEVIHKKTIDNIKMLYLKIAILKYAKDNGIDIQAIEPSLQFSEYVDPSLKEKISQSVKKIGAKDSTELVTKIFNNIIYDDDALNYIKVDINE